MEQPTQMLFNPSPEVVGNAFVLQYFLILHQTPDMVHRFYQNLSKLGRPEKDGVMNTTTGSLEAINERILSLRYGEHTAEIITVDSQESHSGGVIVLVTGYLIGSQNVRQKFTQCFFLAPQDNGYYVLNDIFRFVDDASNPNTEERIPSAQESIVVEEVNDDKHYEHPSDREDATDVNDDLLEEEEVEVEVPEPVETYPNVEEVAKKSYASILKVVRDNAQATSAPVIQPKPASKSPEPVASLSPPAEAPIAIEDSTEVEGEGPSIYVKNLPVDATPSLLENEFKKFGPIKPNGIQVKCPKGFCFGFVEFETAEAVEAALEASPMVINGCRVMIEEKRSTSRVSNRGRFPSGYGNGGYRYEGTRGRGNYGGRGYSRAEFGRGGGRGGYSNRGGEGYRRGSNGGGRVSRVSVSASRNVTPRASDTA